MSDTQSILKAVAILAVLAFVSMAAQTIFTGDGTQHTVELTNPGNLDTPVQSITITNTSRSSTGPILSSVLTSGYTIPSTYLPERIISFESSPDGLLTDFQNVVTIPLKDGMQADGDDFRFYDAGTPVPYNIISSTASSVTVNINTTIPASGGKDIVMTYGNPALIAGSDYYAATTKDFGESGLVALYHMDEGAGFTITDSSGNGHTGTLVGDTSWGSSPDGGYELVFDGNGDTVSIPYSADMNFGTGSFSVSWVLNIPSAPSQASMLFGTKITNNPAEGWVIGKTTGEQLWTQLADGASATNVFSSNDFYQYGLRTAYTVSFARSGDTLTRTYYVNGDLFDTKSSTIDYDMSNTNPFIIYSSFDVAGQVDELRLYNRVLSPAEIEAYSDGRKYTPNPPAYTIGEEVESTFRISPVSIQLDTGYITTNKFGSYPIVPSESTYSLALTGNSPFNYEVTFNPLDLIIQPIQTIDDGLFMFKSQVIDHTTGYTQVHQPEKIYVRFISSNNINIDERTLEGTTFRTPVLPDDSYKIYSRVYWSQIDSWSNEVLYRITVQDGKIIGLATDATEPIPAPIEGPTSGDGYGTSNPDYVQKQNFVTSVVSGFINILNGIMNMIADIFGV